MEMKYKVNNSESSYLSNGRRKSSNHSKSERYSRDKKHSKKRRNTLPHPPNVNEANKPKINEEMFLKKKEKKSKVSESVTQKEKKSRCSSSIKELKEKKVYEKDAIIIEENGEKEKENKSKETKRKDLPKEYKSNYNSSFPLSNSTFESFSEQDLQRALSGSQTQTVEKTVETVTPSPVYNYGVFLSSNKKRRSIISSSAGRNSSCCVDHYNSLPNFKVLGHKDIPLINIFGPETDDDMDEIIVSNIISARATSTYPHLPQNPVPEGYPICDVFRLKLYNNRVLVALADGCNWGKRPQEAAQRASLGFMKFMESKMNEIKDVQEAGHFLLCALDAANREIVLEKKELSEVGTTTLLGGVLLQLENKKWGFVCVNIGDCKAFLWSRRTREVIDITAGNRSNLNDARDPGGRLGPYLEGGRPDLRNLKLYFIECSPKDLIFLISDGVHDNCDPQTLGKTPADFQVNASSWEELTPEKEQEIKGEFLEKKIYEIITKNGSRTRPKPKAVTRDLLKMCWNLTEPSREWMRTHPNKKLPSDYSSFPGKMDHSSCVCFKVGIFDETTQLAKRRKSISLKQ